MADDDPESLLAKAMADLSVEERNQALEDIHGVADLEEDPRMVQRSFEEFGREITKQRTTAYDLAEASSPAYVSNRDFWLIFLRTELFDVHKAVKRLMSYFDHKLWLFGVEKLTADVTQSDLSPDDMEFLETGTFQVLAQPDRAGRIVTLTYAPARKAKDPINVFRGFFYFLTAVIRSSRNNLLKGVTGVVYNTVPSNKYGDYITWECLKIRHAFPIRGSSVHLCFLEPYVDPLLSLVVALQPKKTRVRTRIHFGSDLERQYQLKAFGVSLASFPIDLNGNMDLSFHRRWLKEQLEQDKTTSAHRAPLITKTLRVDAVSPAQEQESVCKNSKNSEPVDGHSNNEEASPQMPGNIAEKRTGTSAQDTSSSIVNSPSPTTALTPVIPEPHDVLFGRGAGIQKHPGNVRFRKLVELHTFEYEQSSNFEKTLVASRILQTMQSSGARFLKAADGDRWVEVDEVISHKKVCQCFRTRRHRKG